MLAEHVVRGEAEVEAGKREDGGGVEDNKVEPSIAGVAGVPDSFDSPASRKIQEEVRRV